MLRERIRSKRWAGIVCLILLLCLGAYFLFTDSGSALLSERRELRARPEIDWIAGLQSPDRSVRFETAEELGSDPMWSRFGGLGTMVRRVKRHSVPVLAEMLREGSSGQQRFAMGVLGMLGEDAGPAVAALLHRLDDEAIAHADGYDALDLLGGVGPLAAPATARLTSILREGADSDRIHKVLRAIGSIGPAAIAALPEVVALLDRREHRDQAIETLSRFACHGRFERVWIPGPIGRTVVPKYLADLERAIAASDDEAESESLRNLASVGAEAGPAVPRLIRLLGPRAHSARVLDCLESIGPAGKEAIFEILPELQGDLLRHALRILRYTYVKLPRGAGILKRFLAANDNPELTRLATCALADVGDPRDPVVIRAMLEQMRGDGLHSCAATSLVEAGPTARGVVPELETMLDGKETQRLNAALVLTSVQPGHARIRPTLRELLRSSRIEVALHAAEQLTKLEGAEPEVVAVTLRALAKRPPAGAFDYDSRADDGNMTSACAILRELGSNATPAIPAVLAVMKNTDIDYSVRETAADTLGAIGGSSEIVAKELEATLADRWDGVRQRAALALASLGEPPEVWREVLVRDLLWGWSYFIRRELADAVGEMGERAGPLLPTLRLMLDDPDPRVATGAALALSKLEGSLSPDLRSALERGFRHPDLSVQFHALIDIEKEMTDATLRVDLLLSALRSPQHHLRTWATRVVGELARQGVTSMVERLVAECGDAGHPFRGFVVVAIGEAGAVASNAREFLRRLSGEQGGRGAVARQARIALRRIEAALVFGGK